MTFFADYEAFYLELQDMQMIPKLHLNKWWKENEVVAFYFILFECSMLGKQAKAAVTHLM